MNFTKVLARLAAQILLGIAVFLWGAIAALDPARGDSRWVIGAASVLSLAALVRLSRGGNWMPWAGAVGLVLPIGVLAHDMGAHRGCGCCGGWLSWRRGGWIREGHNVRDV